MIRWRKRALIPFLFLSSSLFLPILPNFLKSRWYATSLKNARYKAQGMWGVVLIIAGDWNTENVKLDQKLIESWNSRHVSRGLEIFNFPSLGSSNAATLSSLQLGHVAASKRDIIISPSSVGPLPPCLSTARSAGTQIESIRLVSGHVCC